MKTVNPSLDTKSRIGLFDEEGRVKIDKVIDFMEISKAELASAFGLTGDQLRPNRIASRTKEIIGELAGTIDHVAGAFSGNQEKTRKWFNLPNAHFGGSAPKTIILTGRFHRVRSFIYASQKR